MSTAAEIVKRAQASGVHLQALDGKLRYAGRQEAVRLLLPDFMAFKADLLRLLKTSQGGNVVPDLPARVRQKFRDACKELGIDPQPVLRQFDLWKYPRKDLQEMDGWDKPTINRHGQLLADEAKAGIDPYRRSKSKTG